jgi:protocatechuate 4,5-dioxygenase beta chain
MARLVGGFCLPHNPLITGAPEAPAAPQAARVMAAFAQVRAGIERLRADTVIIIGDDHYTMFGPGIQPRILIGIGDVEGPIEPWLNIERRAVANDTQLATHLMNHGFDEGFDWAVSKTLSLDHSTMVPIHLAVPPGVPAVPVYISCGVAPLISGVRCQQLGAMLARAVQAFPEERRVVILGTGGVSHWVGMAKMGQVNVEFDRHVLRLVEEGNLAALVAMSDEEIICQAGNGALELRNWIVAMAALPGHRARLLAYETVEAWVTGLGFAELELPHTHE